MLEQERKKREKEASRLFRKMGGLWAARLLKILVPMFIAIGLAEFFFEQALSQFQWYKWPRDIIIYALLLNGVWIISIAIYIGRKTGIYPRPTPGIPPSGV